MKAKVFLSYARADGCGVAAQLRSELSRERFTVFQDTEETLAGEEFKTVIMEALRKCDLVVALITPGYAHSSWCHAEYYLAHSAGRPVIPIRFKDEGGPVALPEPLSGMIAAAQYVEVPEVAGEVVIHAALDKRLRVLRRRIVRKKWLTASAGFGGFLLAASGLLAFTSEFVREVARKNTLNTIGNARKVLGQEFFHTKSTEFRGDERLRGKLLVDAENEALDTHVRLNAKILAASTVPGKSRWFLKSCKWEGGVYQNDALSDTTFASGSVNSVEFQRVYFGNVIWGSAPNMAVSSAKFLNCSFSGGGFLDTNMIDCDFTNCTFDGGVMQIKNFGAVRFASRKSNPSSAVVVGGEVCSFSNSVISHCTDPSPSGTMNFRSPENEVMFDNVVFESCRFRGLIRSDWFKRCSFRNCLFPDSAIVEELMTSNHVVEAIMKDEGCP
ncbi:TIR domain-containing protein [Phragmitibacter flavus]|uniref:TIR domain-containing protein n=1 Tax=Phragmitibacter flavus TaxID=2576071 RepID=A0A5R8KJ90_9BACT|nr:TIR domain-containing protein [Phragmitibacter flavus]TLD71689.1 TIR domain-containing protein [Phragmitibacter flavus]